MQITSRLRTEVDALRTEYTVQWALPLGGIILTDFRFPARWRPQQAPVFVDVPETYPAEQPTICIPTKAKYTGGRIRRKLRHPADGWSAWCINRLDWDPYDHDIPMLIEMTMISMKHPTKDNPFEFAGYDV